MQSPSDSTKIKAPADERARLRRNQRNSRARKQEYVQDLERRWSDCLRLGVQASVEIQREARRIHEENAVLRDVIRELGMSDDALRQRLHLSMSARSSPHDPQNGDSASATCSPTNATPSTTSTSNAVPTSAFDQTVALPFLDAHATNALDQTTISHPPVANVTDALQTWDLYSWVNDLANIKDAYSFNAQSQVDCSDASLLPDISYHDPGNAGVAAGAAFIPIESNGTGSAWPLDDSQSENNNAMFMQSRGNAHFTHGHGAETWFHSNGAA